MPSSRKPESPVICARRPKARVPDAMPVKAGQSANRALAAPLFHPPEVAKPPLILALRQWSGAIQDVALLAHECYHATQYLHKLLADSEWHGVEEDAARLMERLIVGCLEALRAG